MSKKKELTTTQELKNKIAVITGASQGIGFAIAETLASHGCNVVLAARTIESIEDAATKLADYDVRVVPFQCDVRDEVSVERLFALVEDEFGRVDFLVNNAGIYGPAVPVDKAPSDGWQNALETNLFGAFLCTKHALPLMKSGAVIVNNVSIAAYQVFPNSSVYIASKQGLLGLTNATREDVRSRGIRVLALVPGATDTEIWKQFWPEAPREKMIQATDVARIVVAALMMPPGTVVNEIRIGPTAGVL